MPQPISKIKNVKGKRVLIRVDINVPIKKGIIIDETRIQACIKTVSYLVKKGAKIILVSHMGDSTESLKKTSQALQNYIPHTFVPSVIGKKVDTALLNQKNGEVILLENIRSEKGEEENDPLFAKTLAKYADIYVNEAFPVSHRKHASIVGIPKYIPSYMGFQFEKEIKYLSYAFKPKHPVLAIVGGAKFSTKLPLINSFLKTVDTVYVAGALMNTLFSAKGYEIGNSLVEKNPSVTKILKSKKIVLPNEIVVSLGKKASFRKPSDVHVKEVISDIGPEALLQLDELIQKSKTVIWNGPLGKYEDGFAGATEELLFLLSKSKAKVIIGGGDTIPLITKLKLHDAFFFVSTGGGATLEFLTNKTLTGIKALK